MPHPQGQKAVSEEEKLLSVTWSPSCPPLCDKIAFWIPSVTGPLPREVTMLELLLSIQVLVGIVLG